MKFFRLMNIVFGLAIGFISSSYAVTNDIIISAPLYLKGTFSWDSNAICYNDTNTGTGPFCYLIESSSLSQPGSTVTFDGTKRLQYTSKTWWGVPFLYFNTTTVTGMPFSGTLVGTFQIWGLQNCGWFKDVDLLCQKPASK